MTYEEAKTYLLKTIEFNPSDVEAYKLLTKICLKNGEAEEILQGYRGYNSMSANEKAKMILPYINTTLLF